LISLLQSGEIHACGFANFLRIRSRPPAALRIRWRKIIVGATAQQSGSEAEELEQGMSGAEPWHDDVGAYCISAGKS
jgi:hypothetical protein